MKTADETAAKVEKYPTGNVNLSPFDQWLNAYKCLLTVINIHFLTVSTTDDVRWTDCSSEL